MDDQQIRCHQCGRDVDDSLTWCPACGVELKPIEATTVDETTAESIDGPDEEPLLPGDLISARPSSRPPPPASAQSADPFDTRASVGEPAPSPFQPTGRTNALPVMVALGLVLLVGLGAAVFFLAGGSSDGGGAGQVGDINVNRLEVGQCWNDPENAGATITQVLEVPGVLCSDPHHNEVYALVDHPLGNDASFPGQAQIEIDSFQYCLEEFEGYVGVPFAESPLDIFYIFPTAESWSADDREIVCSLYRLDEVRLTGSEKGSSLRLPKAAIDASSANSCVALADLTLELAQQSIDYFDSLSDAELDALTDLPEEAMPLVKSESLILARAAEVDCSLADINALVIAGSSQLRATGEFGQFLVDDIAQYGFFTEPDAS